MSFYSRLDSYRNANESDRAFGNRIGIDHRKISMWRVRALAGLPVQPRSDTLLAVARALNCTTDWLLSEEDKREG